jgi:hypothetical protein
MKSNSARIMDSESSARRRKTRTMSEMLGLLGDSAGKRRQGKPAPSFSLSRTRANRKRVEGTSDVIKSSDVVCLSEEVFLSHE